MNLPIKDDFINEIQTHFSKDESLKWQGQPYPKLSVTLLEFGGDSHMVTGPSSIFGFILGGLLFFGFLLYKAENWLGLFFLIVFGLLVLIIPDIIKNKRKQNTKYAVSNQRIYFQLWRFGKQTIHSIDFKDIKGVRTETHKKKLGVIYFLPLKPFDFYTYDFSSGLRRHYPTFEMVKEVEELESLLKTLYLKRLKDK